MPTYMIGVYCPTSAIVCAMQCAHVIKVNGFLMYTRNIQLSFKLVLFTNPHASIMISLCVMEVIDTCALIKKAMDHYFTKCRGNVINFYGHMVVCKYYLAKHSFV